MTSDLTVMTERFLNENGIRYDHIIHNAPYGERVLIDGVNDDVFRASIVIYPG